MYIKEETAQLILDALAWCNKDWYDALGWDVTDNNLVETSRGDFIRFCDKRGIEGVERKVIR